jgi:hypothetical protein
LDLIANLTGFQWKRGLQFGERSRNGLLEAESVGGIVAMGGRANDALQREPSTPLAAAKVARIEHEAKTPGETGLRPNPRPDLSQVTARKNQ